MARNTLSIRLDLIQKNYKSICRFVAPLKVMAVLKANAYGLGAVPIAEALKLVGCRRVGVADIDEALELATTELEVQILGDLIDSEFSQVVSKGFIAPVTSYSQAKKLSSEALLQKKTVKVHFLIDTGMGRLGMPQGKAYEEIMKCKSLPNLECEGIYSHFPHAYVDASFSSNQLKEFSQLVSRLKEADVDFDSVHIANSDGIHNVGDSTNEPFGMVRTGINLFGYFDLEGQQQFDLHQVLELKSKLVSVRELAAGSTIGYGRTYRLDKKTKIGTVAIGYADGMPVNLSNNGSLIVDGQRCPIVGRVSMDYTTIDLSGVSAEPGDDVLCLGKDLDVDEWALKSGTINYDVICSIGARVKRVYLSR
jgi:alanine racemase